MTLLLNILAGLRNIFCFFLQFIYFLPRTKVLSPWGILVLRLSALPKATSATSFCCPYCSFSRRLDLVSFSLLWRPSRVAHGDLPRRCAAVVWQGFSNGLYGFLYCSVYCFFAKNIFLQIYFLFFYVVFVCWRWPISSLKPCFSPSLYLPSSLNLWLIKGWWEVIDNVND